MERDLYTLTQQWHDCTRTVEKAHFTRCALSRRWYVSLGTILLVALSLIAGAAIAQEAEDCAAPGLDQVEMNICFDNEYKKADAQLNVVYRRITDRLKDDKAKNGALVAAERAWVAFRDAECDFSASGVAGVPAFGMIRAICLTKLTDKRIDDLKSYLNCPEGQLDCPLPAM
jgi:uncharacterized protein YecT (DUF1311 family)